MVLTKILAVVALIFAGQEPPETWPEDRERLDAQMEEMQRLAEEGTS